MLQIDCFDRKGSCSNGGTNQIEKQNKGKKGKRRKINRKERERQMQ